LPFIRILNKLNEIKNELELERLSGSGFHIWHRRLNVKFEDLAPISCISPPMKS